MKAIPLQTRVTFWSVAIVALAIVLVGVSASLFLYWKTVGDIDGQLRSVARKFFHERARHKSPARENPHEIKEWLPISNPPLYVEITRADGAVLFRSKNLKEGSMPDLLPGFRYGWIGRDNVRFAAFSEEGVTLRLGADLDRVDDVTAEIAAFFLVSLPLLLGLVTLGGRWIAHQALLPIQSIAQSAEQVTARHLDRRVPVPEAEDEIRRLALVLNGTFERLESSFRQASRFSADASHELKTPLTVLRASLEALLHSPTLAEADQPAVAGLLEQVHRLSSITSGLLLLARADAGRLALDLRPLDLGEILESCCLDAQIVAEPSRITIDIALPGSAPVRGDETRLKQIVSNLLDNAIKYNRPGGRLSVVLRAGEGGWELEIGNTGPGIAPEHQPHIFERFFRPEHFEHVGGHGLGLSLARELARAHGGTLALLKSDAQWTAFGFSLPALASEPAQTAPERYAAAAVSSSLPPLAKTASNQASRPPS